MSNHVITATSWLLDSASAVEQPLIRSTYMLVSEATGQKGTAFSLSTGTLITNEHVVRGAPASDLIAVSSTGDQHRVRKLIEERDRDLAALEIPHSPDDGFRVETREPGLGERVHTWGYPLAYNGPSPILSVGYMAGFNPVQEGSMARPRRQYVINGAFNPGNSGGPLIGKTEDAVVGVVVSKHAPISEWHLSAIKALQNQTSGFQYTATDSNGVTHKFSEGQLVGDLLMYFREMTQVVIGEAIAASELVAFLENNGIEWESIEENADGG